MHPTMPTTQAIPREDLLFRDYPLLKIQHY